MNQLQIHKQIDAIIGAGVNSADVDDIQTLIAKALNPEDAKRYFFYKADESWLQWLWDKKFLKAITEKAEDSAKYTRMAELKYLARMGDIVPVQATKIIKEIPISKENLNLEVLNQFIWIIDSVPVEQAKELTSKMRDEGWIRLMRDLKKSGYEFHKLVENLSEAKEFDALLELAQAILTIKTKEELKSDDVLMRDNPFYLDDINDSGIFKALANVDEKHAEQALKVVSSIVGKIVKLSDKDDSKVFDYGDYLGLYDVDFFTLELEDKRSISYRVDFKNLAAVLKKLVEKTIGAKCENTGEAKRLFKYIDGIPTCRSIWRLRLFALSQCTEVFKSELKDAFFKVFNVGDNYYSITGGAEYHQTLEKCFHVLEDDEQREFINKIVSKFGAEREDKRMEDSQKREGAKILVCIKDKLTAEQKKKAKKQFLIDIDKHEYKPKASVSEIPEFASVVTPRPPIDNIPDFSIDEIVKKLKTDWTPEKLNEEFKEDDFLRQRGVEGLGDVLKEDVKKRTGQYLVNLHAFFDRDGIDAHYFYSILRGFEEMLRSKHSFEVEESEKIINVFDLIRSEGKEKPFKRENRKDDSSWLVDWVTVHKICANVLLRLLEDQNNKEKLHKKSRNKILDFIEYLFTIKDSPSKDDEKPESSEPFHIAINSVRGVAYRAFMMFVQNDGEKLGDDVRPIFEEVLKDDSIAVRFVIGHYLASFYFRDKDFVTKLFPKIFPKDDPDKKDIYIATWEGYLANTLYDKLFKELKEYYEYAIELDPKEYPDRKYLKGLDTSLAIHVALAFAHLGLETTDDLFKKFWATPNTTRHNEFISFIGRSCLTRDQAGDEWLKENNVSKEKLLEFWDWVLENNDLKDPEIFTGFGFWINPHKEVLDDDVVIERISETIKRTGSEIDREYGLLKRLPIFAEKDPSSTLEIISNYLLKPEGKPINFPMVYESEIREALKIIYSNESKKKEVETLINTLIEKWSSMFWSFKEILTG